MKRFIEVCCESPQDVRQAEEGGAQRVELCSALELGGITPSAGAIVQALENRRDIKVNVLIRPRSGNFVFSEEEVGTMVEDVLVCKQLGADGVVIGALDEQGNVDNAAVGRLVDAAKPEMSVTFHRAFDRTADPFSALEEIIALDCDHILTSGHAENAEVGADCLAELVRRAGGRIVIMPGKGVRTSNIEKIEAVTHATEFHSSSHGPSGHTDKRVVAMLTGQEREKN